MKQKLPGWHRYAQWYRNILWAVIALFLWPCLGRAQQTGIINYEADEVRAGVVLKEIERQTGATLTWNEEDINTIVVKKIHWSNFSIQQALRDLQRSYGILYSINGNSVALKSGPVPQARKQQARGKISGKVMDEETGEPVGGTTIRIGNTGTTSDVDGVFTVELAKGTYTASVSSVGYGNKIIADIEVKNNEIFPLNLTLKREKNQLKSVTVTASAKKEGVSALYMRQKNNAAISDGISAEQINRTPDKNIGEVLKRISGVATVDNKYVVVRGMSERYNQAMLNGQIMPSTELNRKNFSYDMIPANMIESITVFKTITPDLSAEFGGGLVQVNTREIPVENFLSLSVGGTVNDKTTGKEFRTLQLQGAEYSGGIADHRKLFGRGDWSNRQQITDYFNGTGKDQALFSNNWKVYHFDAQPSTNFQVSAGRVMPLKGETKLGVVASASYRNTLQIQDVISGRGGFLTGPANGTGGGLVGKQYGFTTNIGALAGVGYSNKSNKISWQNFYTRVLDQQLLSGVGANANDATYQSLGFFDNTQQSSLWQSQLKGEHAIGEKGVKLRWMGSYISLDRQRPDNHVLWANILEDGNEGSELPHDEYNITTVAGPAGSGALRSWSRIQEKNYSWDASVVIPFKAGITYNSFKAGTAGWYKKRQFYVVNATSTINDKGVYPSIGDAFTPEYEVNTTLSPWGDDAQKSVPLYALYGMMDNKIAQKLRLVWGLRAESYDMDKMNEQIHEVERNLPGRDASVLYNREKKWQFFPSANFTYSLTPRMNLRLAYSKSIIRPDLRDLSFFKEYDFELGGLYLGGRVRSTILHNYDFRYEWYIGPGEVISASLFYKDFKYPMEIYQQTSNPVFELKNNYSAKNKGIEVEVRKSLAFTGVPVIRNITIYGNFTYMDARVRQMTESATSNAADDSIILKQEIKEEERRPLTGQSNYMYNAGVFYDSKYVGGSISYNYVTNRVYRPSYLYGESLFERPIQALDLQLTGRFLRQKLEVKINISNLLNSYSVVYRKASPPQTTKPSAFFYKEKEDLINYKSSPGKTYGLILSYNF